jgi:hypothetical protein
LWTKPFHGVQHLGTLGDMRWATVTDYGSFAELTHWARGVGITGNPQSRHDSAEQARQAGERWVRGV